MFNMHFFENVTKACKQTTKEIKHGFHSRVLVDFCVATQHEVEKATPKSGPAMFSRLCAYYGRSKHAAESWDAELFTNSYGGVIGFFINNSEKVEDKYVIDFLEYGTPPHDIPQPTRGMTIYTKGIAPMGFVRKVQEEMERKVPKIVRRYFDKPISGYF